MATTSPGPPALRSPASRPLSRRSAKPILWAALGLAGISVLIFTDYPEFAHPNPYRTHLLTELLLLIPHAVAGVVAIALGPFLFSTRFRSRHLKRHRIMGRVYVLCIAIAAPIAGYIGWPQKDGVGFTNAILSALWFLCTLAAFLTARNRQLVAHRQWMIRSYIFTLNFIFTRLLNPLHAWSSMSDASFGRMLLVVGILYLFLPDLYFNRHELTTSRRP